MPKVIHHNSHFRTIRYTVVTTFTNLRTNGEFRLSKNPGKMVIGDTLPDNYFIGNSVGEYSNKSILVDKYDNLSDLRNDRIDKFDNIKN